MHGKCPQHTVLENSNDHHQVEIPFEKLHYSFIHVSQQFDSKFTGLEELQYNAGVQFDLELVSVFIRVCLMFPKR